jgi:hypothetical protein
MLFPVAAIRAREVGLQIVGTDLAGALGEPCLWGNLEFEMEEGIERSGCRAAARVARFNDRGLEGSASSLTGSKSLHFVKN